MLELKIGWTDKASGECNERSTMRRTTGDGLGGKTCALRESAHHDVAALMPAAKQLSMRVPTLAIAEDSHGSFCSIGARKEYEYHGWFAACEARNAIRSS